MQTAVLEHRIARAEEEIAEIRSEIKAIETRTRVLEIAHARILGWAAGGAFAGGGVFTILSWLISR